MSDWINWMKTSAIKTVFLWRKKKTPLCDPGIKNHHFKKVVVNYLGLICVGLAWAHRDPCVPGLRCVIWHGIWNAAGTRPRANFWCWCWFWRLVRFRWGACPSPDSLFGPLLYTEQTFGNAAQHNVCPWTCGRRTSAFGTNISHVSTSQGGVKKKEIKKRRDAIFKWSEDQFKWDSQGHAIFHLIDLVCINCGVIYHGDTLFSSRRFFSRCMYACMFWRNTVALAKSIGTKIPTR